MDTLYWVNEYMKVLCAFIFLIFIWPSVIFSRHLKGKGVTYRFSFCVTVQVILITAVVLLLGVCHILQGWVMAWLFYGTLVFAIFRKIGTVRWTRWLETLKKLLAGTYRPRHLLYDLWEPIKLKSERLAQRLWKRLKPHAVEYVMLLCLILFGVIYFSYGALHYYAFGTSDMYVHHQWIDAMLDGDIFFAGIYPRGMHCVIYSLHVLFGISLYSCIHLLAGVQIIVTLTAAYVFLRRIFRWRYTPLFVLALFLTVGVTGAYEAFSMARLQWTLPQEFGMYTEFLSALFLVRCLEGRQKQDAAKQDKKSVLFWNESLFIFAAAIATATIIHFYCTIIALILCLPFVLFEIKKLRNARKALSLGLALMVALGGVALPMAAAYWTGVPLQGSLRWAMNVMEGPADAGVSDTSQQKKTDEKITIDARLQDAAFNIYWRGYVEIFQQKRANFLLGMIAVVLNMWACYRLVWPRLRRLNRCRESEHDFDLYVPIIVASFLFIMVYVASYLDLPQIVEKRRVFTMENLLALSITVMPIDMLFALLSGIRRDTVLRIISMATVAGIYLFTIHSGTFHGYLFTQMAQYNAEVAVADSIVRNFPPNSFTIVSTTSELYQIKRGGRHEELIRFVEEVDTEEYFLPTEYIFLFVEKRPLQYGQFHFYGGPEWLGNDMYYQYYQPEWGRSLGGEVNSAVISAEAAQTDLEDFTGTFDDYVDIDKRTVLESKAYLWCQNFMKVFPFEMTVYYEDDSFVCYCIRQNLESPFNLAIENWQSVDDIDWTIRPADSGIAETNAIGGLA